MIRQELAFFLITGALLLVPFAVSAGEHEGHAHAEAPAASDPDAMVVARQLPSYPLTSCPVSGEELGSMGDPIDYVHEGRLVRLCCGMCEEQFLDDPAKYLAEIDAAVIEDQKEAYALATCPISGMKLGGMGEPHDHVHGTRLVRFCCDGCLPKFGKDPEAAMAKVDAALMEAQVADYTATMCPVTSKLEIDVMGKPHDILYGTRLVRLCCAACVEEFWRAPERYLAKLDEPNSD